MSIIETGHRCVERMAQWPGLASWVRRQEEEAFRRNRDRNLFMGVYDTWPEAEAAAAAWGRAGYDNADSAAIYDQRLRMDMHDYPSLCWITRSLREGMKGVFDVGGSIGIKFLAFRDHLQAWPDLTWCVYDVPAMVAHGRELSVQRGDSHQLRLTSDFADGQSQDILLASGVLQYLPQTLDAYLRTCNRLPRRIIVNTAALHPTLEFFTVNSIGTAFCPYRIQTQASVVRGLSALGYRLRESWQNPDKPMRIPGHAGHSLQQYSGFCMDLQG